MKSDTESKKPSKSVTKQTKSVANTSKKSSPSKHQSQAQNKSSSVTTNAITKQNYDIMSKKFNITQITPLEVKYVLRCIEGLFKHRFLYITTHKQGEIIGSANPQEQGLTLQIQGVGLAPKHAKLKFNGFKKFYVKDFNSKSGTWLKISKKGQEIKHNDVFIIDKWQIKFEHAHPINQIQELCSLYKVDELADLLIYNKITNVASLYRANYEKFKEYPFTAQQVSQLNKICEDSKNWFNQQKQYKLINMYYQNEEVAGFSEEVGWVTKRVYPGLSNTLLNDESNGDYAAEIVKGYLIPKNRVFSKIEPDKNYQMNLHDQIKIGDLVFQLNRFNVGAGESFGGRELMQDCYIMEEDVGGSQWKLISLFAVLDGYGGNQCMLYVKQNLIKKIREWTPMLDEAGDLNQMLRVLMFKTFYELDYQFYQKYPQIAGVCGTTLLLMLVIDSKIYVFNLGDNKGLIYRDEQVFQLNIDHIPGRVDEKARIEQAGGFVQYNRLNGKCTLSRAFGQFQYKDINDYKNNMKGKLKSCLSCIPEVVCFDINPSTDQFIILSTDGIFDVLSMKQIVDYILERSANLEKEEYPNKIVSSLMENCKITNPQCDNMAAILIFIKKGRIGAKISF